MTKQDVLVVTFNIDRDTGNVTPNIPAGVSIGHLLLMHKILDLIVTELMTKRPEDPLAKKLEIARVMPGH